MRPRRLLGRRAGTELTARAVHGGPVSASPHDFPLVDLSPEELGLLEAGFDEFDDYDEPEGLDDIHGTGEDQ
ncbi:hypothetical protein GXW82_04455 [Streptacidiphilus sp. 4-A2]|nr:hypothetical protein [Streptacidiphilus sp. 4-A2]